MTRGNWITIGIFVFGVIASVVGTGFKVSNSVARDMGRLVEAVERNTRAIEGLDGKVETMSHDWATREQARDDRLRECERAIAELRGRL